MPKEDRFDLLARGFLRVPVPWVFVITYLIGAGLEAIFDPGFMNRAFNNPAGVVLFCVGAVLAGWGWLIFRNAKTTRVPGEISSMLVTWGPYRLTRNPMYVGLSIAYLGEAGILHQFIPILLLPITIAYLDRIVIPLEENRLHEAFGADYSRYRSRVRRWL